MTQRKYFEAYALTDEENLRSNKLFHSALIFLHADCDEEGNICSPLYIDDCYGFYSHNIPYEKSFFEEPLAFFTQIFTDLRFRGSFGQWKQEAIHDLTLGRGLTGRLFEKEKAQIDSDKEYIQHLIEKQNRFLWQANDLTDQEKLYSFYPSHIKPIPEFNAFPLTGGANSCKTASLGVLEHGYDPENEDHKRILDHIYFLRYGSLPDNILFIFPRFLTSFIPRLTPDLEEFIFHCESEKWEKKGTTSQYPYCDWKNVKEDEIFAIAAGNWYMDLKGNKQPLLTPDKDCKNIIKNLKAINRICEINISEDIFKVWHEKINYYLRNLATSKNAPQQKIHSDSADEYLHELISSPEFRDNMAGKVPVNLQPLLDEVNTYYAVQELVKEESDEGLRPYYGY